MHTQKFYIVAIATVCLFSVNALAQSKAYQRKKPAAAAGPAADAKSAAATPTPGAPAAADAAKGDSEKLDIKELEQKYWAPKDTDFSVVQNRTYTKAKRVATTLMAGPLVNDPYNAGLSYALKVNYYLDERYGFEFTCLKSDLTDGDATTKFRKSVGGGVRPDFNRDLSYYGFGYNWVPFYAKMSFMGKKIIYFDMQITPTLGMSTYEQQSTVKTPVKNAFTYGVDITQYFFFSEHLAVRADLQNRFYKADVLAYTNGTGINAGDVKRSGEMTNTTIFLLGLTYFFK